MELWNPTDDAALDAAYREFLEAGPQNTEDIEAEQIGHTVLMSLATYRTLTQANHDLAAQSDSFQGAAARWCEQARKQDRSATFWCGAFWVVLGIACASCVFVDLWRAL
jgi:hypothetical protein